MYEKKGPKWNKKKKAKFASLKTIREANELIRLLNSSYMKNDAKISVLANNVMLDLKDKEDNRRELFKELKRNNNVVKFKKHINSPNNIYNVIMSHINAGKNN